MVALDDLIQDCQEDPSLDNLRAIQTYFFDEIRGQQVKHLPKKQCQTLCKLFFSVTWLHTESIVRPMPTPEAKLALAVFKLFLEDVEEFQDVVETKEATDLGEALRFERHVKCGDSDHAALAIDTIVFLSSNFPKFSQWRAYVLADAESDVAKAIGELPAKSFDPQAPRLSASDRIGPEGAYYDQSLDVVVEVFKTDLNDGLTEDEAADRLEQYGPNVLPQPEPPSIWKMLWRQLTDFMVIILIIAACVSLGLGDFAAGVVLFVVVITNVIIGFTQEYKAEKTLAALQSLAVQEALVLRDGLQQVIDAERLVPGDIVILEEGNQIPADLRVCESINLQCVEAILTGEPLPIEKHTEAIEERGLGIGDRKNMCFMSTAVSKGRGRGVTVATGKHSEVGKISKALSKTQDKTTILQERLNTLGKWLVLIAVVLCGLVVGIGIAVGREVEEMIFTGISLAVSVIPEGLVAVVTVTMALGVHRMAKENAVMRRLPAVETLGSVTTICSDKTGTLTEGKMKVEQIFVSTGDVFTASGSEQTPVGDILSDGEPINTNNIDAALDQCLMVCALCNNSSCKEDDSAETGYDIIGGPTEVALLLAAYKANREPSYWADERGMEKLGEIPFDSNRKRMAVGFSIEDEEIVILAKGAPENVLARCTHALAPKGKQVKLTENHISTIEQQATAMAGNGLRVLGLATRTVQTTTDKFHMSAENADDIEKGLTFVGLCGLIDPPRDAVRPAVEKCKGAGIRVIMITGDHPTTAKAIAKDLGILEEDEDDSVMRGRELDALSEDDLIACEPFPKVFARVSPENKLSIVSALQKRGDIAAMTGDGVNDAPAIKNADIGIAMGIAGTDLTKQSADMVLTDDNFATIVKAVKEGRRTYDNIRKFVLYLLSCNSAEIWVVLTAVCIPDTDLPVPFSALQILWANLIADIPPALSLGADPAEPDVLRRKPRNPQANIFTKQTVIILLYQSWSMACISLTVFLIAFYVYDEKDETCQQLAFTTLTFIQLIHSFLSRSVTNTVFSNKFFENRWLVFSVILSTGLLVMGIYTPGISDVLGQHPITGLHWAIIFAVSWIHVAVVEICKIYWRRKKKQARQDQYSTFYNDF